MNPVSDVHVSLMLGGKNEGKSKMVDRGWGRLQSMILGWLGDADKSKKARCGVNSESKLVSGGRGITGTL